MTTNNKIAGFEAHKTSGLEERHTCGSSRVGVRNSRIDLLPLPTQNYSMKSVHYSIGSRTYKLSNQLPSVLPSAVGNVLSVISDTAKGSHAVNVIPQFTSSTVISEMRADIRVAQDYSPFGVTLDGRSFVVSEGYRFGFQGQEEDDEIKGDGNSVNYKYRMHDPRIGRFFAVDPLKEKYPFYSPYSFSGNRVIDMVELEGLEPESYLLKFSNIGKTFNAVSHANGQEGKKYYWTLKQTSSNSIGWVQGNRYTPPKPKPANPVSKPQEISPALLSAVRLENTLNKNADESWNAGNYWDAFTWKLKAWESGIEGETGFYRKGIPLMAGTAATVLTMGASGSLFGTISSGYTRSSLMNGGVNAFSNGLGQYAAKGDFSKIDYASVGLSFGSAFLKNPWSSNVGISVLDAAVDINGDGTTEAIWNKSTTRICNDMIWGMSSNHFGKGGSTRLFISGAVGQYGNSVTDEKIKTTTTP